jgi:hypothetical protein
LCWRTATSEVTLVVSVGPQLVLEDVLDAAVLARPACPR